MLAIVEAIPDLSSFGPLMRRAFQQVDCAA
jgi:hypothetical protein